MGIACDWPEGATPIDPEEAAELIPRLATQAELNAFEASNIAQAALWAMGNRRFHRQLLTDAGIRQLHRRMFGATWRWAGRYRLTGKSIGVEAYRIPMEIRALLQDVDYWIAAATYDWEELAARFHHRLVVIHPFVNGNGRHARLATDLLCERNGWSPIPMGLD